MTTNIRFTLNDKLVEAEVEATELLVDMLRIRFGLTGTKMACGTGDCGACTVIIDNESVRSCILLAASVNGKSVLTIEGLGNAENVHPIQMAFIETGAIQCGYCIPGMIMTTKALLDKNPNPSIEEIKDALSGNLCRCTGYTKIIESVRKASNAAVKQRDRSACH